MTGNGALVVELLTRAHRAGFTFTFIVRPAPRVLVDRKGCHDEHELQAVIGELRRWKPDVLAVLARTCTVRTCEKPTWAREFGTDLPWCRGHGGTRGLQLLHEERPDLFPALDPHAYPAWLTKETAA